MDEKSSDTFDIGKAIPNGDECTIPTPENCATFAVTVRVEKPKVQAVGKGKVAKIFKEKSAVEVNKLGMQSEMLALLHQACILQGP